MNFGHLSSVILAEQLFDLNNQLYISLGVITFIVLGLFLFSKAVRTPKGLIISSLISYVFVIINVVQIAFHLRIPNVVENLFYLIGIYPTCILVGPIVLTLERLFGQGACRFVDNICIGLFVVNTLLLFAIFHLILYIRHKVKVKKQQTMT